MKFSLACYEKSEEIFPVAVKKFFNNKQSPPRRGRREMENAEEKNAKSFWIRFLINFIWSKLDLKSFACLQTAISLVCPQPHQHNVLKFVVKTHTQLSFLARLMFVSKLWFTITSKFLPFTTRANVKRTSNIKHQMWIIVTIFSAWNFYK